MLTRPRTLFFPLIIIICMFLPGNLYARESAADWLKKAEAPENYEQRPLYILNALEMEPNLPGYFFGSSNFSCAPGKEIITLNAMAHAYLSVFAGRKEYAQTLAAIEKAAKALPENPDIQANLAYLYLFKKDERLAEAFSAIRRGLDIDPAHRNILRYLSDFCNKFPPQDVEALLSEAIKKQPQNPYAWQAQGMFYFQQGKIPEAIEAYTRAAEQDPDSWEAFHGLGRLNRYAFLAAQEAGNQNMAHYQYKPGANSAFQAAKSIAYWQEQNYLRKYYDKLYAQAENPPVFETVERRLREKIMDEAADKEAIRAISAAWILNLESINLAITLQWWDFAEKELMEVKSLFSEQFVANRLKSFYGFHPLEQMYGATRQLELNTPLTATHKIAAYYENIGDKAKAMQLIGVNGYARLKAYRARELESQAKEMIMKDDFKAAQSLLRRAARIAPEALDVNSYNYLALLADKFKNYSESIWARERHIAMAGEKKAEARQWRALAFAQAVIGDYKAAYETVQQGRKYFPNDDALFNWGAGYAYGANGWDRAAEFWQARYPGKSEVGGVRLIEKQDAAMDMIYNTGWALGREAEAANNRYAALKHYSMAFFTIPALLDYKYASKKETMKKIIDIYNRLPLKPRPPQTAVIAALKAEEFIRQKNLESGRTSLYNAISAAPWWPEAHYNLALVLEENWWGMREAVQEMGIFLRLAPNHSQAQNARQKISGWQKKLKEGWQIEASPDIETW